MRTCTRDKNMFTTIGSILRDACRWSMRNFLLQALVMATSVLANDVLTCGHLECCALLDGRSVKCWGANHVGQLGQGDVNNRGDVPYEMGDNLTAINLGDQRTARSAPVGFYGACAILDGDGALKCWGWNSYGQLGLSDTTNRGTVKSDMGENLPAVNLGTGRTARSVSIGGGSKCAVLDNNAVKCWGRNGLGQLGLGDMTNRGDGANEMGDNLPEVDLGTGRTAGSVAVGGVFACAVLDDASLKCWGQNGYGQLGQGDVDHRGDGANEMGNNLTAVNLGTGRTAKSVSCSTFDFACAVLDDGSVKCWGRNDFGQLGQGDSRNRGGGLDDMGDNLPAVDLGTGRTAKSVSAGGYSACALLDNDTVKCWGQNNYGQLGQGHKYARGDWQGEMGDIVPAVDLGTGRTAKSVTVGEYFACALLDNNSVKCWGVNFSGQLGLGDRAHRGDEPDEMGDNLPAVDLGTGRTVFDECQCMVDMGFKA